MTIATFTATANRIQNAVAMIPPCFEALNVTGESARRKDIRHKLTAGSKKHKFFLFTANFPAISHAIFLT